MFSRKKPASTGTATALDGNVGTLLHEIANGPQQRRLTATTNDLEIVLDTSNRELMRIVSVQPDGIFDSEASSIQTRDDDNLAGQLALLGGLLAMLAAAKETMTIQAVPVPLRYSAKLQGFSSAELATAAHDAPAVQRVQSPRFLDEDDLQASSDADLTAIATPEVIAEQAELAGQMELAEIEGLVRSKATATNQMPPPAPPVDEMLMLLNAAKPNVGAVDTRFFDQFAAKCDAAVIVDLEGHILQQANNWEMLENLCTEFAGDMKTWARNTARTMSARQCIVLRNDSAQDSFLCFFLDINTITILVLRAALTGRVFSVAKSLET